MNSLNAKAFGLAFGVLWAFFLAVLIIIASFTGWGVDFVNGIGKLYIGVDVSLKGAIIALPWALVDAGIGGYLLAWLYNKFNQ